MKLVASLIVAEAEKDRYLQPCVEHLLTFCEEVVLLFDRDYTWARDLAGVWRDGDRVIGNIPAAGEDPVDFFAHEGRARQKLLEVTLRRSPTHVLQVDCDEFVSDGARLRADLEADTYSAVWTACMQEVWTAYPAGLMTRQDGGWAEHDVTIAWAPGRLPEPHRIPDRALACGRVPEAARRVPAGCTMVSVLHFGWAARHDRQRRYARYAEHDGGRFHAGTHLRSILDPDYACTLRPAEWPPALLPYKGRILGHVREPALDPLVP